MRTALTVGIAALALGAAQPALAQSEIEEIDPGATTASVRDLGPSDGPDAEAPDGGTQSEAELAELGAMMSAMFQADPLDAAQEARLPAAREVVGAMMPPGFYAELMGNVMETTLSPMMALLSQPGMVIESQVSLTDGALDDLSDEQLARIASTLDPAYERRGGGVVEAMTAMMTGIFATLEEPMRDGLSRAYAVRFDDGQLADIAAFFATPTGAVYATESTALFADPQVMSATMGAMPQMFEELGGMEDMMAEALADLPTERSYADLSVAEREEVAGLLGMETSDLELAMALQAVGSEDEAPDAAEDADEMAEYAEEMLPAD